ncbi:GNAT family N-acetyltransferase [Kribbella antibiotica]|uniref:GNAT family N-acetyltransferase n=1 Tax=Kribbella antibiotica TaxID=190195 RepID=UPI001EDDB4F5|nr:GNAT family N-acetyltransferase [Kribbella antibiotica]
MDITRLSPDDEAGCIEVVALLTAVAKVDSPEQILPTPKGVANGLRYGWDLNPSHEYLARDADGTLIGMLNVHWPKWENLNQGWFGVEVHPDHRRRGIGSELVQYFEKLAADAGKDTVGSGAHESVACEAFAAKHGYERKAIEVQRRQDLTGLDWDVVQALYDKAAEASTGYELLRLNGALPEEMLEDMVAVTESINDAPTDDLDIEDDVYSTQRLRDYEEAQRSSDMTTYRVVAREKATGKLAGHTLIAVDGERPWIAWQHDTAVSRDHRGHRLGALVKADLLLWLRESAPEVKSIDTWNAESNNHMIGINEQLNYRIIARDFDYQKKL